MQRAYLRGQNAMRQNALRNRAPSHTLNIVHPYLNVHKFEMWWLDEAELLVLASWHDPEEADKKDQPENVTAAARAKMIEGLSLRLNMPWARRSLLNGIDDPWACSTSS